MAQPAFDPSPADRPLRILAVTRKPDSASYEQRVLHFIPHLKTMGD